jgi:hypothetical protein
MFPWKPRAASIIFIRKGRRSEKMKLSDSYSLDEELIESLRVEAKRLGISKSLLVETILQNGIRQVVKDYGKARGVK